MLMHQFDYFSKFLFLVFLILFLGFDVTPVAADTFYPQFAMRLDKEAYNPGETIHAKFTLDLPQDQLKDFKVLFQVYDKGIGDSHDQEVRFESNSLDFSYKLPDENTTWFFIVGDLFKDNNIVDMRNAIVYTTDMQDGMKITGFTMDKTYYQPGEMLAFHLLVRDKDGTIIRPQEGYAMFCYDKDATNCYGGLSISPEQNGTIYGSGDIPSEYLGNYKVKIVVTAPKDSDYRPASYVTDIRVEGTPLPKWSCGSEEPVLCFDSDVMGPIPRQEEAGGEYPLKIKVDPNGQLRVKIYHQSDQLYLDKTFHADDYGIITAEYKIPNDAMIGFYTVDLISQSERGKSYYGLAFHIGGNEPWGAPVSAGEILFQSEGVDQDGKIYGENGIKFVLNNPITISLKTVTPQPHTILPNRPVNITLYGSDGNVVEQRIEQTDADGKITYTFTPTKVGHYKTLISTEYPGVKDTHYMKYPVGIRDNFTIVAEGKQFQIKVGGPWYSSTQIKNLEFNQQEKRLSMEIDKTDRVTRLDINIPYELLDGGYTVFTNGKQIRTDVGNSETSAVVYVPVDDTVTNIDVVGTTAIPEFPVVIMVISIAIGIILYVTRFGRAGGFRFIR